MTAILIELTILTITAQARLRYVYNDIHGNMILVIYT